MENNNDTSTNKSDLDSFMGAASFYDKQSKANFQLTNEYYIIFYEKNSIWITELKSEPFKINEIVIGTGEVTNFNKSVNDLRSFQFCVNNKDENTNELNYIKLLNSNITYFENKKKFKIIFYFSKHCNIDYELDDDTTKSFFDRLNLFWDNNELNGNKFLKDCLDKLKNYLINEDNAKFRDIFESKPVFMELLNKYCTLVYEYEEIVDLDEDKLIQIEYNIDDINRQRIRELDPKVFQAFRNLQKINFSDNEIDALHPDLFKNLNYLQEIDFSSNSINRIEWNLFDSHLEMLTSIKLEKNQIIKLPSNLSEKLKMLKNIDASNNQIINLDGNIFAYCPGLIEVNFNQNSIRELNRDLFQNNANLSKIWFDENKISFLPYGFFRGCNHETTKLTEISFKRNNIEKLEASIFRGLVNLNKIDFSYNKISELSPDIFVGLNHLLKVDFSHNNITHLHLEIFDDFISNYIKIGTQVIKEILGEDASIDFRCQYKSLNIFSAWDYQRVYNEFFLFNKKTNNFEMKKDVFDQYLIMLCLSKHEITPDGLKEVKAADLKEYFKKVNENEIVQIVQNFTLLDFFLMCNGISTKMLINILDKVEKKHIDVPFKVTTQDSIEHICKHGNEELITRIDKYFEISEENNFKYIFEKVTNESSAIGFLKIFWKKIKYEYKNRYKSEMNFQDIVCKYKFYLNDCLKRCFDAEWWSFLKELLEIHDKEINSIKEQDDEDGGNLEMAQFYLTLFEKNYNVNDQDENRDAVNSYVALPISDSDDTANHQLRTKKYKDFDLRKLENIPVNDHLLNLIKQSKRDDLILHPTTKEFLDQKWKGIPRNLYFFHLVTYIVFIILYLIHLEIIKSSSIKMRQSGCSLILNILLFVISFFFFFEEIIQLAQLGRKYWNDNQNKLEMPTYLLCLINVGSIFFYNNIKALNIFLYVLTIIFLFGILILRLKNIEYKNIGVYTTVFEHIIKKSSGVLPVVLLSLLAFSFAFRVSAKTNEFVADGTRDEKKEDIIEFYNGTYAYNMMRLLTMSLGEYSTYQMGLFVGLDWVTFISNYIAYLLFIFILPLLVINMFIGISVDEMRKLIEKSENQNFKNRIEYVLNIQTFLDRNHQLLEFLQANIKLKCVSYRPIINQTEKFIKIERKKWFESVSSRKRKIRKIRRLKDGLKKRLNNLKNLNNFNKLASLKEISMLLHDIGKIYYEQENHDKALEFFQMALVVAYKQANDWNDNIAKVIEDVCKNEGKCEQALNFFNQINISTNNFYVAIIKNDIGAAYDSQGQYEPALKHYKEALIIKKLLKLPDLEIATTIDNIGRIYKNQGNLIEALKYYQDSLEIYKNLPNTFCKKNSKIATTIDNIGQIYKSQGKFDEALKHYQDSLGIYKNLPNNSDRENLEKLEKLLIRIRETYKIQGNNDKVLEYKKKIIEIRKQIEDTKTTQNKSKRKEPNIDELINESLDRIRMVEERIKEIHKEVENSSFKQMAQVNEQLLNIQDRFEKRQSDIIEIINKRFKDSLEEINKKLDSINKFEDGLQKISEKLNSKFKDSDKKIVKMDIKLQTIMQTMLLKENE